MALYQNDPFPGTDYAGYLGWQKVVLPTGQVLYEVPGNPGYVYDPVASAAAGRKVFRQNPKIAIDQQKQAEDAQKAAQKQAEFNASPAGQLIPVVGTVGGLAGASYFMNPGTSPIDEAIAAQIAGKTVPGAVSAASPAAAAASGAMGAGGSVIPAAEAMNFVPGVEQASTLGAEAAGIGVTPYLGAAGALLGGYGLHNAIQANDSTSGALSGGGLGLGLGMAAPLAGFGPLGWGTLGLMAAGGALGGFGLTELFGHKSTRERQADVTEKLMKEAGGDPVAQNYVAGVREQFKEAPPDPDNPYGDTKGNKFRTFQEYKDFGLDAANLTHVEGNIDVYSPQVWAKLTEDQRRAITQANIDSDLYYSKDGGVKISDEAAAKKNFDSVMQGFNAGTQAQAAAQGALNPKQVTPEQTAQAAQALFKRSSTLSPGIGLDGRPIHITR